MGASAGVNSSFEWCTTLGAAIGLHLEPRSHPNSDMSGGGGVA